MDIEYEIKSIIIESKEIHDQLPGIIEMMNSYLPQKKTSKRRKKKETMGSLIEDIIDSIE